MASASSTIDPSAAFLEPLIGKLRRHPKRIVFPEGNDVRVLRVAEQLVRLEAAAPILLGDPEEIRITAKAEGISTEFVRVLSPAESSDFALFCKRFVNMERYRKLDIDDPEPIMAKPHYFAAMMVQYGQADAIVGGNQILPAGLFRALFHMIKPVAGSTGVSSATVLVQPENPCFGSNGILILADTAVIPEPTVEQLAEIAVESGKLAARLLDRRPKVALLSFANKGSAHSPSVERVSAATALALDKMHREGVDLEIDGELQADVALLPEISRDKCGDNRIQGEADVLVFPDLNSGHIARKLLAHAAGAQTYGQMLLGLARPVAQVSRVASDQTIFGAAVAAGIRAIQYRELLEAEDEVEV